MSENELRPLAREVIDSARQAQTPTLAHRERAYQALMAGLGGAATVGTVKIATSTKVAGQVAFASLKWAIPAAILASAAAGTYGWAEHRRAALPAAVHALAAPTLVAPAPASPASAAPSPGAAPDSSTATPSSDTSAAGKPPAIVKAPAGDLGDELALLHRALAASRSGNAARALELARQHARQYPNSKLRIERDAIEVRSLCVLGRAAEAHKIADRLHTQAPNSPVSAALEETCVGK